MRREWLLTPVFLPGELHGQRSLAGYSPQGHKELDRAERLTLSLSSYTATNEDFGGRGSIPKCEEAGGTAY